MYSATAAHFPRLRESTRYATSTPSRDDLATRQPAPFRLANARAPIRLPLPTPQCPGHSRFPTVDSARDRRRLASALDSCPFLRTTPPRLSGHGSCARTWSTSPRPVSSHRQESYPSPALRRSEGTRQLQRQCERSLQS